MIIFEQNQTTTFSILYLQKQHVDRVANGINVLSVLKQFNTETDQKTLHIHASISTIPSNTKEGIVALLFLEKIFIRGYDLLIIDLE
jgi:hypothetical protein